MRIARSVALIIVAALIEACGSGFATSSLRRLGAPGRHPGAKASVTAWANHDGCVTTFNTLPETLDIDDRIDGPNGPAETTTKAATGCRPGGAAELWTIQGGRHAPEMSGQFASYAIDFLLAHPKP